MRELYIANTNQILPPGIMPFAAFYKDDETRPYNINIKDVPFRYISTVDDNYKFYTVNFTSLSSFADYTLFTNKEEAQKRAEELGGTRYVSWYFCECSKDEDLGLYWGDVEEVGNMTPDITL